MPAARRRGCADRLRQRAAVEGFAACLGDQPERLRLNGAAEQLAGMRRAAMRQKSLGKARLIAQRLDLPGPNAGDGCGNEETVGGVTDGGLEEDVERQRAVALVQRHPSGDAARHGDAVPAERRHRRAGEHREIPAGRRAAGGIQAGKLLAVPDDREGIASDAVHGRLDDGQRDGGSDRCVDGVAAARDHARSPPAPRAAASWRRNSGRPPACGRKGRGTSSPSALCGKGSASEGTGRFRSRLRENQAGA